MLISVVHILMGLLLLAVPAVALYVLDRQSLGAFSLAVGRMAVQVLAWSLMAWGVIHVNETWLNLLWLVVMSVFGSSVVLIRIKASVKRFILPIGLSLLGVTLLTGMYLLYGVLPVRQAMDARWFVPVTALLQGHTMAMLTRGFSAYLTALKADEQQYEFLRGNGTTHLKAVIPFLRRALQAVMAPTTANLAAMGLFTMPLLLTGILLGGHSPIDAFVLTLLLTVCCLASSVGTLVLSVFLADKRLFDRFGKLIMLSLLLTTASCEAQGQTVKYELPAPLKDRPEQILHRKGYTTSYNQDTKTPNWVAWHLTESHTRGSYQRKNEVFSEDEDVKGRRATNMDYYNSRYDRGHMCPAGDNKWDKQAMSQSFLFTNICPQNHGLNKYEWNDLEILCREWARKYGAVDIVCGPVYYPQENQRTIGKNKVRVPHAFFKVILCRQGKPKAIGFIYRNEGVKQPMANAVRSVDEIERLVKMDFFPALDDATESRIEREARLSDW